MVGNHKTPQPMSAFAFVTKRCVLKAKRCNEVECTSGGGWLLAVPRLWVHGTLLSMRLLAALLEWSGQWKQHLNELAIITTQGSHHITMSHSVCKAASGQPFHAALSYEGGCLLPGMCPLQCSEALAHLTCTPLLFTEEWTSLCIFLSFQWNLPSDRRGCTVCFQLCPIPKNVISVKIWLYLCQANGSLRCDNSMTENHWSRYYRWTIYLYF